MGSQDFSSNSNMRFKRGGIVEVSIKKIDLLGEWRLGQIVEDHGNDGYTVRYHGARGSPTLVVDRVSTEAVRPFLRPQLYVRINFAVGDVVDVMYYGSWRVCMVKKVSDDKSYYYVQVIGSKDQFKVSKACIRPRIEWRNNKWARIRQGDRIDENLLSRTRKEIYKRMQRGSFADDLSTDTTVPGTHVEKVRRVAVNDINSSQYIKKVDTPVSLMWDHQNEASSSSNASNRQNGNAQQFSDFSESPEITVDENGDLWVGPDVKITFP